MIVEMNEFDYVPVLQIEFGIFHFKFVTTNLTNYNSPRSSQNENYTNFWGLSDFVWIVGFFDKLLL